MISDPFHYQSRNFNFSTGFSMALSIDSAAVNCIAPLKSVDQQCLSCKFNHRFPEVSHSQNFNWLLAIPDVVMKL